MRVSFTWGPIQTQLSIYSYLLQLHTMGVVIVLKARVQISLEKQKRGHGTALAIQDDSVL